jgi:LPS-assembly protein
VFCFIALAAFLLGSSHLAAQVYRPSLPPPPAGPSRPGAPDQFHYLVSAVTQETDGPWTRLRISARIETTEVVFRADEIDYHRDLDYVEARGHVQFENLVTKEKINCDKLEYYIAEQRGRFSTINGSAPARIEARPGLLTTQNPFYFQGEWAERTKDRYILHNGFVTDCLIPRPWWVLKARRFDVIPDDRAIARGAIFYVRKAPVFYMPFFYKSLKKQPRSSGFLTPNMGNSSRRGFMVGAGYFWAINRSYDLLYRTQLFSQRGFAHNLEFRGKVSQNTDFNLTVYGVNDRGTPTSLPAPGALVTFNGRSQIGRGWEARGELNYLSSFAFRQIFTESFQEAIFSQTQSVGYLSKHWSGYGLALVAERGVNFQSAAEGDHIALRKLPQVEFVARERAVRNWPVWVSLEASYGLVRRSQPLFQTRQFVERLDLAPRVMSAWHWKGVHVAPSFGIRETAYDSSVLTGRVTGANLVRSSRDVTVDLALPPLTRVFRGPTWFGTKAFGERAKHVLEARAVYRFVSGVNDFAKIVRFDSTELVTNTNEVEYSLTNRVLGKDRGGAARDVLSWELWYKRYFDPTFGGAIQPGERNVIQSSAELTGYAFLDGARRQSPVVSVLRVQSKVGLEWRADYDPVGRGLVNSGFNADARFSKLMMILGHYQLKTDPVLAPSANQFRGQITYGGENQRGWNLGFAAYYDYRVGVLQYSQSQATYNTDCCGFSVQYRRFSFGTRSENQFRVAFAISNIGSVGTLRRQERIF